MSLHIFKKVCFVLAALLYTSILFSQNPNENNCFRHFDQNAQGQHNINQYLVSMLCRLTYPERLGADLSPDGRRVPVADNQFEQKFRDRCTNWFYDPASEPKEPQFNPVYWNQLNRNCKNDFTESDWATLEDLYYTATNQTRPVPIKKPVLATGSVRQNVADQTIRAKNPGILPANEFSMEPIRYKKATNGRITQMRTFADKGEELLKQKSVSGLDCQKVREQFVDEVRRFKVAINLYQISTAEFQASIPSIHYIKTNSLEDPEAVLISTPKYILVLFRGTDEYLECYPDKSCWPPVKAQTFFANLQVATFPAINHSTIPGRVHTGWYASAAKIERQLVDLLTLYNAKSKKVWLAGHSKGAGEATIMTAMLAKHHQIPVHSLYTFGGTSSVGDNLFSTFLNNYFNPAGQFRMQRFELIHDYVASSDLHLLDEAIFGYRPAGARCFYDDITKGGRFFFNKEERNSFSKFTDGEMILSLATNPCQHIIDNYCRAAYFLLERTNGLRSNLPAIPAWHGNDSKTCTTN